MWMPKKPEMTADLSARLCLTTHLVTFSGDSKGTVSVAQLMESLPAPAKGVATAVRAIVTYKVNGIRGSLGKAQTSTVLSVD